MEFPGFPVIMDTVDGAPVLRFERHLAHAPEKVWRAITDPAELAHWFPSTVEFVGGDFPDGAGIGAAMRFTFGADAPTDTADSGEVLGFDPPKVFAFRWSADVLRFELIPDGAGCVLRFSQTLGGGGLVRISGMRNAAGWDFCLDGLAARLAGEQAEQRTDWLAPMEGYAAKFGLDAGECVETPDGYELRFARDLVWKPLADVWALLTEGGSPEIGSPPPPRAANDYVPAGAVTGFSAPHTLEYQWCQDGAPAGDMRWKLTADPDLGHRVELTQTIPAALAGERATALAAWHVHLELFFAAVFGEIRCPWPAERTDELRRRYAESL